MMNSYLTGHDLLLYVLRASAWLTTGGVIGAFHFLTLRWNVHMFALVRFALIACLLAIIASHLGALPPLAAAAGILAARMAVVQLGVQR
jgi:hypothetical protein